MALIKNSDTGRASNAVVLDLGDLARQADAMISRARAEADQIIADARHERERLISGAVELGKRDGEARGREAGFAAGVEQGREQAYQDHAERLAAIEKSFTGALADFDGRRRRLYEEARRDVLRLALAIGSRVARRALAADEHAAVTQLDAALAMVFQPHRLLVLVSPADEEMIAAATPALVARFSESPHVEVRADPSLEPGECVVRTDDGEIDARLSAQLDRIAETLLPGSAGDAIDQQQTSGTGVPPVREQLLDNGTGVPPVRASDGAEMHTGETPVPPMQSHTGETPVPPEIHGSENRATPEKQGSESRATPDEPEPTA